VHHAAVPGRAGAPVVVHVHGLGVEQITLYRQEVLTARAAAAAGFPVLRWHARGHGDSAGSAADVTLDTLVEDARMAADEAKRRSGATRVVWLGVRLGALVAAIAAQGRSDTAGLVLWEPVAKPADFFRMQLRTLLFSQVAGGKKPDATVDQLLARLERDGSLDVLGYTLYQSTRASLEGVSLAEALAGVRVPVRIAQIQTRAKLAPAHVQLVEALGGTLDEAAPGANDVRAAHIQDEPGYQLMTNPAWQCDALTRLTVEWLDAMA
jgi:pimeloyl-ACP methyl ester carboxylesterase